MVVPQLRFVYQLADPRAGGRPLEQLNLHLNFDAVDREAHARQIEIAALAIGNDVVAQMNGAAK